MKYDVYRNLTKKTWSLRYKGVVYGYQDSVVIDSAKFVVQPAGRARVIRERRKNVHAFVRGEAVSPLLPLPNIDSTYIRVHYNPYLNPTFTDEDGNPILSAKRVILTKKGECYAKV